VDRRQHNAGDRGGRRRDVRRPGIAYFPELFNARYRYTGIAVSKEFAALASWGIAPFIATALLGWSGGAYWPIALYVMVLAGITFIATFFAPETRGADLKISDSR